MAKASVTTTASIDVVCSNLGSDTPLTLCCPEVIYPKHIIYKKIYWNIKYS